MKAIRIGYARCSTDKQDLAAQRSALENLGVTPQRIYTDHGLTGTNRARPRPHQALAAVRAGDTFVVSKLDRLARSVPDARGIADALIARGVSLALGASVYDPADPMGKMFFNTFAEFEADLIRLRTREGMAVARAREAEREATETVRTTPKGAAENARYPQLFDHRSGRTVLSIASDRLPGAGSAAARHSGLKKTRSKMRRADGDPARPASALDT
jgi:DNA invertase Pin-like site-specific DNA recombinase